MTKKKNDKKKRDDKEKNRWNTEAKVLDCISSPLPPSFPTLGITSPMRAGSQIEDGGDGDGGDGEDGGGASQQCTGI